MAAGVFVLFLYFSYYLWHFTLPIGLIILYLVRKYATNPTRVIAKLLKYLLLTVSVVMIVSGVYGAFMKWDEVSFVYYLRLIELYVFLPLYINFFYWYILIPVGIAFLLVGIKLWPQHGSIVKKLFFVVLILLGLFALLFGTYGAYLFFGLQRYKAVCLLIQSKVTAL